VVSEEPVAEVVARGLARRGWTLGTVECGTGGAVGHRLFDTEDGPAVLGSSLVVDTAEEAVDILELPWQQFGPAGEFSAKAARAAARAGLAFLDADLCLVVWAQPLPADVETVQETVYLALNTGQDLLDETVRYDGPAAGMSGWLAEWALGLVSQALT
jgi:nicotinamide mononucleotide (NMN) deamidase PncC